MRCRRQNPEQSVRKRKQASVPGIFLLAILAVLASLSTSATAQHGHEDGRKKHKREHFGPWDAGSKRAVSRQGRAGRDRAPHPFVGDQAKVPGEGPSAPPLAVDPDVPETALENPNRIGPSLSSNPLWLASLFYSNFLTRVDGPRCHHYPTCSRFASQAVAKHKVMGLFLGLDRIIQPPISSALRGLPSVDAHGTSRSFDPLENYEFWKPENFTGFPAQTDEEPLTTPAPSTPAPRTPAPAMAPKKPAMPEK